MKLANSTFPTDKARDTQAYIVSVRCTWRRCIYSRPLPTYVSLIAADVSKRTNQKTPCSDESESTLNKANFILVVFIRVLLLFVFRFVRSYGRDAGTRTDGRVMATYCEQISREPDLFPNGHHKRFSRVASSSLSSSLEM